MATETQEVLINVKVEASAAVQRQVELKSALEQSKLALDDLKKATVQDQEAIVNQEASIAALNQQLRNNANVLKASKKDTEEVTGAYAVLNQKSAEAAAAAKDLAATYGVNDARTKEATASAKKMSDQLKEIDKSVGQNQRSVGDYGLAVQKLPGIFGEMADKGQSVLVSLRTKFESVKDATMSVRDAMAKSREATAVAMHAAEKAAIAEEALATAKKTGAASSALAAEAETARAAATTAGTVATNLASNAMKIFKIALISTGIGALVVALGAVVAYFTQTNEGSKQFAKISAGVNAVMQSGIKILGSYGKLLFAIATFDLKKIKEGWAEIGANIKNATGDIKENYQAGVQNTANQQMMAKRERTWSGEKLQLLKEYEEARFNAGKKSKLDDEGKIAAAKKALQINELIFQNDLKIAKNKAKMVEDEQKLVSKKDYQAIQDSKNKVQEIINAHGMQQLTVDALLGKAEKREQEANAAGVKSHKQAIDEKATADKQAEEKKKAADEKAEADRLKTLKDNADKEIKALDDALALETLKRQEQRAGQKLSDDEFHAQKQQDLIDNSNNEAAVLDAKLLNDQITQEEFNKQSLLNAQKLKTDLAIEDAAFEAEKKQKKIEADAIDFQTEYDTALLNNENMFALEAEALEAKRLAEIAAAEKTGADVNLINEKYTALNVDLKKKEVNANLNAASQFAGNIATIFGKNTKVGKAAASAQIAIDTYKGAMAAFASMQSLPLGLGIPAGIAAAAAVAVQGGKAIKDVWATKSGLPGDGGGGGQAINAAITSTATNVTGGLVARTSGQTQQQAQTDSMNTALKANPVQPVLVVDNVTDAQVNKANVKVLNSL